MFHCGVSWRTWGAAGAGGVGGVRVDGTGSARDCAHRSGIGDPAGRALHAGVGCVVEVVVDWAHSYIVQGIHTTVSSNNILAWTEQSTKITEHLLGLAMRIFEE